MPVYHSLCRKTLRIRVAYQHDCKQGRFQRRQFFPPILHFWLKSLCPSCNLKGPKARFYTGHQLAKVQRCSIQPQFSWEFQLLKFQDAQIPIVHSKLLLKCQNSIKIPLMITVYHLNFHEFPQFLWPLQADLLRLLRSIRPSVGEDEAEISPLLGCSSATNHGYWAFSSEILESLCFCEMGTLGNSQPREACRKNMELRILVGFFEDPWRRIQVADSCWMLCDTSFVKHTRNRT